MKFREFCYYTPSVQEGHRYYKALKFEVQCIVIQNETPETRERQKIHSGQKFFFVFLYLHSTSTTTVLLSRTVRCWVFVITTWTFIYSVCHQPRANERRESSILRLQYRPVLYITAYWNDFWVGCIRDTVTTIEQHMIFSVIWLYIANTLTYPYTAYGDTQNESLTTLLHMYKPPYNLSRSSHV